MPSLEKVLEALGERKLKLTIEQNDVELLLVKSRDKNIDLIIKDIEKFKELIKELRK